MENGFIYPVVNWILLNLKFLNLVEGFKWLICTLDPNGNNEVNNRKGADLFIIFKWLFVLIIWKFKITNSAITIFVWYLIGTNLYTYFHYHLWKEDSLKTDEFLRARIKRRFLNLLLAITFSVFSFGYFINVPYSSEFSWSNQPMIFSHALSFSFSNSLAANYSIVQPITESGNLICSLELFITFIFVTLIVSRSIPQTNSNQ